VVEGEGEHGGGGLYHVRTIGDIAISIESSISVVPISWMTVKARWRREVESRLAPYI
jgi:hypothetical protein